MKVKRLSVVKSLVISHLVGVSTVTIYPMTNTSCVCRWFYHSDHLPERHGEMGPRSHWQQHHSSWNSRASWNAPRKKGGIDRTKYVAVSFSPSRYTLRLSHFWTNDERYEDDARILENPKKTFTNCMIFISEGEVLIELIYYANESDLTQTKFRVTHHRHLQQV